jgi:hypothetical protein
MEEPFSKTVNSGISLIGSKDQKAENLEIPQVLQR